MVDNSFTKFIFEWQQLIGAFLGPFLAIIFSGIGFLITRRIKKNSEIREALRKVEVNTTYGINSAISMQKKLAHFVKSARTLVAEVKAVSDPKEFSLNTINFPALGEIHLFAEAPELRVKSYYLHNKILWAHAGTRDVNAVLGTFQDSWSHIIDLNYRLIDFMKNSPNPPAQRIQYSENIEFFANRIEEFSTKDLPKGIKVFAQIKVYNEKIKQRYPIGLFYLWKYEGLSFKYFRNFEEFNKFSRNLESIDRIDATIKDMVNQFMVEMEKRALQLAAAI